MSKDLQAKATEIKTIESENALTPIDIQTLLTKVVDRGPEAIEMLEKLLALQDVQQKKIALAQYNKAKAMCQAELPVVNKTREVWNKTRTAVTYHYASLDDARKMCMPIISSHGFSDGWKTEEKEKGVLVTYTVRHDLGHEESTSMLCPMEQSQYMNNIQRSGSTITYGKRYTFCDFWGVVLDEDDCGKGSEENKESQCDNQEQPNKYQKISQQEYDDRAKKYIHNLIKGCSTDEQWDEALVHLERQPWNRPQYTSYLKQCRKDSDLPY